LDTKRLGVFPKKAHTLSENGTSPSASSHMDASHCSRELNQKRFATDRRRWRLSKKTKIKKIFWYQAQEKTEPGPDGPNALGWYGRLRGPISPLSLINSVINHDAGRRTALVLKRFSKRKEFSKLRKVFKSGWSTTRVLAKWDREIMLFIGNKPKGRSISKIPRFLGGFKWSLYFSWSSA